MFAISHSSWPRTRLAMVFCLATLLAWGAERARAAADPITNAAAIKAMSAAEAAQAQPVRLEAVVMDLADPRERALVLADFSGGVYVLAATNMLAPYHPGDLLEVTGVTDPGEFAPIVKVATARKLGTSPLPSPRPITYHQLLTGALDAQWVELSGVVQRYLPPSPDSQIPRMVLSVDGNLVHVRIPSQQPAEVVVDAEVRVRALCFYQFNQKRQMLRPVLQVLPGIPILVEKSAPPDPFAAPVRSATSLLLYSPENPASHRVHLRGVVTHSQAGSSVWIRDDTAGLRLETPSPEPVQPGDVLDVLGFPKFGSATPTLEDAIYRKLGATNPPVAFALGNPTNAFEFEDGLISLEARLNEVKPVLEGLALSLESAGTVFQAVVKPPASADGGPKWQPGSRVRVAGICSVTYDDTWPSMGIWHPQSFQLLLRSPADVTVLQAPPWWTLQHVAYLLGLATASLLVGTGWIMLLARGRLREQQQHRAMAEAEFAAILAERNRMAREIHDTLAQGLVATSVQLQLARKHAKGSPEALAGHLETAQQLVRSSLEEARGSIWNMRSQVLETGDLASALKEILTQMADGTEAEAGCEVLGKVRRLAPVLENNLLRIGQEAITNATKHAQARRISVELDFGDKEFRLRVSDDGLGFDTAKPGAKAGGFGLVGMHERAAHLKGQLQVHSAPGQGTRVSLTVPLSAE